MIFSSSEISNIISNFSITGKLIKVKKLHSGTVNLSFKISISYKNVIKHYVLQKINKIVFSNPELLTKQTQKVLINLSKSNLNTSLFILTNDGKYTAFVNSEYWRLMEYIEDTTVKNKITTKEGLNLGMTLAKYHNALANISKSLIQIQIDNFHYFKLTLKSFLENHCFKSENKIETSFIQIIEYWSDDYLNLIDKLPNNLTAQLIHGDTRLNNFLFSTKGDKTIYLIDYDTLYFDRLNIDLADFIRSIIDDFKDLKVVKHFLKGYLKSSHQINSIDLKYLLDFVRLLSFELALRFMSDFLSSFCSILVIIRCQIFTTF